MILVTTAIKLDLGDSSSLSPLGNRLANQLCRVAISSLGNLVTQLFVAGAGRSQCSPGLIIDDLTIEVTVAPINREPRTAGVASNPLAHPVCSAPTTDVECLLRFHNWTFNSMPMTVCTIPFPASAKPPVGNQARRRSSRYLEAALPGLSLICSPT